MCIGVEEGPESCVALRERAGKISVPAPKAFPTSSAPVSRILILIQFDLNVSFL